MRAGPLRQRVDLERKVETRRTGGTIAEDYEPWLTEIKASLEYEGSWREGLVGAQIQQEIDCRIRIRSRPGVNEKMRIRHRMVSGSPTEWEYFDIIAVRPADARKQEIHLYCVKRGAEGFRSLGTTQ